VTLTVQFRLSPRLRMTGAISFLLYTPSWREQRQLYLFMCEIFPLCVCGLFNDPVSSPDCMVPSRTTIRNNLSFSGWVACLHTVFQVLSEYIPEACWILFISYDSLNKGLCDGN